jgi:hypothetical protein
MFYTAIVNVMYYVYTVIDNVMYYVLYGYYCNCKSQLCYFWPIPHPVV